MTSKPEYLICFVGSHDPRPSFGISGPAGEPQDGPVLALLNHKRFDEVFLLCSSTDYFERATQIRLECGSNPEAPKVNLIPIDVPDVIDYLGIYQTLNNVAAAVNHRTVHQSPQWSVLLDPGTPQMQTAWILLVRSGRFPAKLIQGIPPRFNDGVYASREVDLSDEALPRIVFTDDDNGASLGDDSPPSHKTPSQESSPREPEGDFEDVLDSHDLVVRDLRTREVFKQAWTVAGFDHEHHLILGETGTGKTRLAKWIHAVGPRNDKPFHILNCATLNKETAGSELFGHKRGAFTGAESDRPGALRTADGGILFLDEIGELSLDLQSRLLHVLDDGTFLPLGSDDLVTVDIVIIAATNGDLEDMVNKGSFRQDLYMRLNAVPLTMPPLRDRPNDLDQLIVEKLGDWNRRTGLGKSLHDETTAILRRYPWPGNLRQLENVIKRVCMLSPDNEIRPEDLPPEVLEAAGPEYQSRIPMYELPESGVQLRMLIADFEKDVFRQALERTNGVKSRAAALVGWEPAAFRKAITERYSDLEN